MFFLGAGAIANTEQSPRPLEPRFYFLFTECSSQNSDFIHSIELLGTLNHILCVDHPKFHQSPTVLYSIQLLDLDKRGYTPEGARAALPDALLTGQEHVAPRPVLHLLDHSRVSWDYSTSSNPNFADPWDSLGLSLLACLQGVSTSPNSRRC
jgi:hypothetical protein